MSTRLEVERQIEQRTAATAAIPGSPRRARSGNEQVGANIRLEVDGEIVTPRPPRPCVPQECGHLCTAGIAGEPPGIQRLDARHSGNCVGKRSVPAADDEIDLRVGREPADVGDRRQGHQQIADPLETQEQDAAGRVAEDAVPAERRTQPSYGREHAVRGADEPAFAGVVDLQGHRVSTILPPRDRA